MDRRRAPAVLALALVALLGLAPVSPAAAAATEPATIFLVAVGDNGQSGSPVGCGDSLIPVTIQVPAAGTTAGKITQALTKLFALHDQYYGQSGLYNALYQSNLGMDRVELQGGVAAVYLTGALRVNGECDDPRVEGQIVATARQVPGVTDAIVVFNGGPLFSPAGVVTFPRPATRSRPPSCPTGWRTAACRPSATRSRSSGSRAGYGCSTSSGSASRPIPRTSPRTPSSSACSAGRTRSGGG